MATLEMLVKLASFGTAGVCVLAVFYIGHSVQKLSNDAPEWKAKLMGKYINACVVIAVICTVSGGVNAYFNREKIVTAEKEVVIAKNRAVTAEGNYTGLKEEYRLEQVKVQGQKRQLTAELNTLKSRLQGPAVDASTIKPAFDTVLRKIDGLQMRSIEEVTTTVEKKPAVRRQINPQ